jgi:hypothetical protein
MYSEKESIENQLTMKLIEKIDIEKIEIENRKYLEKLSINADIKKRKDEDNIKNLEKYILKKILNINIERKILESIKKNGKSSGIYLFDVPMKSWWYGFKIKNRNIIICLEKINCSYKKVQFLYERDYGKCTGRDYLKIYVKLNENYFK